jgi:metal-sulfur cluster biosynthetic enzyme
VGRINGPVYLSKNKTIYSYSDQDSKLKSDRLATMATQNSNPVVHEVSTSKAPRADVFDVLESLSYAPDVRDVIDREEVFEHIRHLNDPEHPLTLEQLNVLALDNITVNEDDSSCDVLFTPTIPHCSMATLIGLCIRVKLLRSLPRRFKITVKITPGAHASEFAVNKQLNDKERVAAALENQHLLKVVNQCIAHTDQVFD